MGRYSKEDFKWPSAVLENVHSGTETAESVSQDPFAFPRPEGNPDIEGTADQVEATLAFTCFLRLSAGKFPKRWKSSLLALKLYTENNGMTLFVHSHVPRDSGRSAVQFIMNG